MELSCKVEIYSSQMVQNLGCKESAEQLQIQCSLLLLMW